MKKAIQAQAAICMLVWMVAVVFGGGASVVCAAESRSAVSAPAAPAGFPLLTTAAAAVAGTNSTNTSYVLGVNDLIRVAVYKEPDLTTETRVDQDGTVSLPLVRLVKVGGSSVAEARENLRRLYERDYLVTADVTITVVTSAQTNKAPEIFKPKLRFTILGEVKKPGNIELPEGEKLDIVRAIGMAEGFTTLANKRSVYVVRQGDQKKHEVDVQALIQDPKAKPFEVRPGDVISVRQTVF